MYYICQILCHFLKKMRKRHMYASHAWRKLKSVLSGWDRCGKMSKEENKSNPWKGILNSFYFISHLKFKIVIHLTLKRKEDLKYNEAKQFSSRNSSGPAMLVRHLHTLFSCKSHLSFNRDIQTTEIGRSDYVCLSWQSRFGWSFPVIGQSNEATILAR